MNELTQKLEKAVVTHSYYDDREECIRLELTWGDVTYKYELYLFMQYMNKRLSIQDLRHDYDCAGRRCPLCGKDAIQDCQELSVGQLELLKEKLVQSNLKLMFHVE